MTEIVHRPGSLVSARGRDWVVLPSEDSDLLLLQSLDGGEDVRCGIWLPLEGDSVRSAEFPLPSLADRGSLGGLNLVHDAARLSFRNAAGPFRSLAGISFRPRAYQLVPLVMALRQPDPVRLMIADDVGIGKTLEALLIAVELWQRQRIRGFAVLVPPHLCDQWQQELADKFGIQAVIVRTGTQAVLDRQLAPDEKLSDRFPFQVVSIDFMKSDRRIETFIREAPELVIVDEVHTAARPQGARTNQQQRYNLISRLARESSRHLILLTATPHSGKSEEFSSLLVLLDPRLEAWSPENRDKNLTNLIARHYVQRRRDDIKEWGSAGRAETTGFPKRISDELAWQAGEAWLHAFSLTYDFTARLMKAAQGTARGLRIRYWTALALLRGVASSPQTGIVMLKRWLERRSLDEEADDDQELIGDFELNPVLDRDESGDDSEPVLTESERDRRSVNRIIEALSAISDPLADDKLRAAAGIVSQWLETGNNPVVFCRYIATAKAVGTGLKALLEKTYPELLIEIVTSEDPDDVRRERVTAMEASPRRILVATDCLSEGINLQDLFTAVLHYDLPWNPNRLEQREGRVDRFGQTAPSVRATLLYGTDNPIDQIVLRVLLRKVREIRRATGVSLPFPEDSRSILDVVLGSVLGSPVGSANQMTFHFEQEEIERREAALERELERASRSQSELHSRFAQAALIAPEDIERELVESDTAIGDPTAVENFVIRCLRELSSDAIRRAGEDWVFDLERLATRDSAIKEKLLAGRLRSSRGQTGSLPVTFRSPVPPGKTYLGRAHPLTEHLCRLVLGRALSGQRDPNSQNLFPGAGRFSLVESASVKTRTLIWLTRVRDAISERGLNRLYVAEEVMVVACIFKDGKPVFLDEEASLALREAAASGEINSDAVRERELDQALRIWHEHKDEFDRRALGRGERLVEAYERCRAVVGQDEPSYVVVKPVLPPDLLAVHILLPAHGGSR